jgi:hypothetical protein
MKYLIFIFTIFILVGCSLTPRVIPDLSSDSAMTLQLKHRLEHDVPVATGYAWIFWYAPICLLTLGWGWREFIRKPKDKEIPTGG